MIKKSVFLIIYFLNCALVFFNVILSQSAPLHVSATHVIFFSVVSARTEIYLQRVGVTLQVGSPVRLTAHQTYLPCAQTRTTKLHTTIFRL